MSAQFKRIACLVLVLIALVLSLLLPGLVRADAADVAFQQRNVTDTGWVTRYLPTAPLGGASAIYYFNAATAVPEYLLIGSGLTLTSGALTATAQQADWNAVSGFGQILNKPSFAAVATTGSYSSLSGTPSLSAVAVSGAYGDLSGRPSLATVATSGSYNDLSNRPTIPSAQVNSDWGASTGVAQILNKPSLATVATSGAYADLTGKPSLAAVATSGSYTDLSNKPTIPAAFNFGFPGNRTLATSTSYQAADPSKAAIIYPSYSCTNATTVLAASACTLQVRVHTSAVTCSTGIVYYTQSLTVGLGLLLTQASSNPVPIFLPAGAYFILCPTAGTFTISPSVEQAAN